jgi:hypothetical protein
MGLSIIVGVLADAESQDEADYVAYLQAQFAVIEDLLDRAGVGPWAEPELDPRDVLDGAMFGYSGLHTVRRLAVHLAETGTLPDPLEEGHEATDDPLLRKAYTEVTGGSTGPFDHLLNHSDCEGYYVPVDFEQVIADDRLVGVCLGSSVRLLAETRRIANALGLPEDLDPDSQEVLAACQARPPATGGWQRYGIESHGCLQLIHAAKHSITTGAAIAFC